MCMNCGCGEYDTKHKPTDITRDDLMKAAEGHNMEMEKASDNIHEAARTIRAEGGEQGGGATERAQ